MPLSIMLFLHYADHSYTKDEVLKATTPSIFCEGSVRLVNLTLRLGAFPSIYSKFHAWSGDSFLHLLLSWWLPPSGSCALFSVMRPGYIYFQALITQLIIWQMPNLAHYLSYAESQLVPTVNTMLNYVLKSTKHESFHRKYTGKKYLQVGQFLLLCS